MNRILSRTAVAKGPLIPNAGLRPPSPANAAMMPNQVVPGSPFPAKD